MHKVATSLKAMYFNTNIYDQDVIFRKLLNDMEAVGHKPENNEIVRRFAPALVSKERTVLADLSEMADNGWNLIIDGVKLYMPSMTTVESQFHSRQSLVWYVEITPEMKEAYEKQLYCKRCGTQYNSLGLRTKEDVVIAAPMYDGYFWCPHCLEDHKLQKQDFASIQLRKFCERNQHKSTGYSLNIPYDDLMRRNVNNRMDGIYTSSAEMKAEGENLTRIKTNLLVREWCHERGLDFKNVTTADDVAYHWFAADPINDGVAEVMHEKLVYFPAKYRLHLHNQRVINDPREQYAEV